MVIYSAYMFFGMSNIYFICLFAILLAFILSDRMFPIIIYTVRIKNLMDEPGDRSTHSLKTPTLGGVGVFATFSVTVLLFGVFSGLQRPDLLKLMGIIGSTTILLFLGVKDDLVALAPKKKMLGQIFSSALVIFATDIRINSFYSLFGIGELPYFVSVLFSMLVFVFIINAFNLIDGIDGLSGVIAILASTIFGLFFLANDNILMVVVSAVLIGALLGFLKYNLSDSDSKKLFLGDSGSMFVGFLLAFQAIYLVQMNHWEGTSFVIPNVPVFIMAVLSYPILDTLRVFIVRIRQKRSPFKADRNHIHHRILDLGLTHKQATSCIAITNFIIIIFTFLVGSLYINLQLYIVVVLVPLSYLVLYFVVKGSVRAVDDDDRQSRSGSIGSSNGVVNRQNKGYGQPERSFRSDVGLDLEQPEIPAPKDKKRKVRNLVVSKFIAKSWEEIKKLAAF
ncbi:MAG: undecaprenyl-phosphate alpha-N-acetylglucosaminyl 1-phosphate transferase [Maribacter sp.]|nr:MAG: undecaprenyl-phosphate alpha-N-acetylglucosaminyl 1-phosphate transferase [Maribacter sp.]